MLYEVITTDQAGHGRRLAALSQPTDDGEPHPAARSSDARARDIRRGARSPSLRRVPDGHRPVDARITSYNVCYTKLLRADIETMVKEAASKLGGLDGLVYNVGIGGGLGLDGSTAEVWDLV